MARDIKYMPADIRKRLNKIESDVVKSKRDIEKAAALAAKQIQLTEMKHDAGGDLRLSRVRSGKGAKIGARYDTFGRWTEVRATGPVPLVAHPMPEHSIPKTGSRLRNRRKTLLLPDGGFRKGVDHPGTKGKDTWDDGKAKALPVVDKIIGKKSDAVVIKSFKAGG